MAYNSDGYIMIDFTEVDFRRTNQTIDGLYKRCVDVIGTNKFILVINANGRTPLPATCSFTNDQYVIDTCIYMFAISSNDNLFIRRNDVPASDIIDDSTTSVSKTWSSSNIVNKLAPIDSETGASVTFNTSLPESVVKCEVAINATQEGSGDPSPVNVRHIHGFSEVNAYQRTVNLWDEEWELGAYWNNTGLPRELTDRIRCKNAIPIKQNTEIYTPFSMAFLFYDINDNVLPSVSRNGYSRADNMYLRQSGNTKGKFLIPQGAYYMRFYMQAAYGTTYNNDISINYPSTDKDYHAYTGNTYTIQLGQEVYGAEVDVVNGVAHCTWNKKTVSKLSFTAQSGNRFTATISDCVNTPNFTGFLCSTYKPILINENNNTWLSNRVITIVDNRYTTATEFEEAMGDTQIVYPIAEPFDIQLTPTQIETLIGNNTIFADTGDTTVYYRYLPIDKI